MKTAYALLMAIGVAACSTTPNRSAGTFDQINDELRRATAERARTVRPEAVDKALLPPLQAELPKPQQSAEPRFDLVVSNAPAAQVLMAIVSGTRYSMLLPPEFSGTLSLNLKDVTVREALETIRELYGYEFKVQGNRIFMQPLTMQTRIFKVNYLSGRRQGSSEVRVTSGSLTTNTPSTGSGATGAAQNVPGGAGANPAQRDSSRVYTTSDSDFWTDLTSALRAIVGGEAGRQVIVNAMSGVIVVRAFPSEQRGVENFLRATQLIVERQVMLEAKIIEVTLRDGYESGVNWAAFRRGDNSRLSTGIVNTGTVLQRNGPIGTGAEAIDFVNRTFTNPALSANPGADLLGGTNIGAGVFGFAFQASNFAALLSFLETQGGVHVLSSPRIATLNNQKAVLKVGSDEFFVTSISTTTTTTSLTGAGTVSPTITVQPFFSGIALDVTPQIDDDNNIILHIHPSISEVAEKTKLLDLGSLGSFKLPLASSSINETDSIVRVQDGNIVAIGGLMRQQQNNDRSGLPGVSDVPVIGSLFGNKKQSMLKSELVILLKPTIIRDDRTWVQDLEQTQLRVEGMNRRTITVTPEANK
ncbi:MAG: pilus (MSHA type) biogenesis protein MshL [Burkholderiales bacterium]|nr:pilus (MSHA type) biogenesis protein MshL [Burkholderiales bacterium]